MLILKYKVGTCGDENFKSRLPFYYGKQCFTL